MEQNGASFQNANVRLQQNYKVITPDAARLATGFVCERESKANTDGVYQ
jgi:hypothetical protein